MKFGQLGAVFETCPSLIFFWADAPVAGRTSAMQASAAAERMSLMAVSPCVDDLRRPDAAMLAPICGGLYMCRVSWRARRARGWIEMSQRNSLLQSCYPFGR